MPNKQIQCFLSKNATTLTKATCVRPILEYVNVNVKVEARVVKYRGKYILNIAEHFSIVAALLGFSLR